MSCASSNVIISESDEGCEVEKKMVLFVRQKFDQQAQGVAALPRRCRGCELEEAIVDT